MQPIRHWMAATLGALAVLAASPALAQAQATVKVGVIGPFTGPSSDFGIPLRQGIELAVAEINTAGGYLGRPLELVVRDDKGNPDAGLAASQDLVKQGVVGTIGFCNTGVAAKSLDVYQNAQSPLIIPCATGTPLITDCP